MTRTAFDNKQRIIKFVQELLLDEPDRRAITPGIISAKIDMVTAMQPTWGDGLDRRIVIDELVRRFSIWIGENVTLKNDAGHTAWLTATRKHDWRYWQRYREWTERKLSPTAVEAMDKSTDSILELLEDPTLGGKWDRRGLVVGHVQSGKTANYSGLICKAADAGYKIIIVLAGLHNNLRSQTQSRLDEAFLGYETKPIPEDLKIIGVGEIDADPSIKPNYATNRTDKGDFNAIVARNLGISPEQRPWLFVVKKNKTVLQLLCDWISNHVANSQPSEGRRIVTHLPVLVIDDEADNASVDTGEQLFDDDGKPDEEHQPTAINGLIRRILHSFSRAAYVGYTATPFANIFIHERGETQSEGPDLFPSAFIVNLASSTDYIGPEKIFGLERRDGEPSGLPLVRGVDDYAGDHGNGWMPLKHNKEHKPLHDGEAMLPPSLVEAIDAFLLTCAARVSRGQGCEHSSMLVHVTRFNDVQKEVCRQITDHLRHIRQRILRSIDHDGLVRRLHGLWLRDFVPTTEACRALASEPGEQVACTWEEILAALPDAIADIDVRTINGSAKDALDYVEHRHTGLKVIAVGGDKLARGLTLEGLSVSYFLRASKMYDTLMQMGRWFGYRPGYLDLCRLYTTSELSEWFGHITEAAVELREEFDLMAASGGTPRDYGLKVQSHPVLMVTSRLKMRRARNLLLSFSGQLLETVALYRTFDQLQANWATMTNFVGRLGEPSEREIVRSRMGTKNKWHGYLWQDIEATEVIRFLTEYRTHPAAHKVNGDMLAQFVRDMTAQGELVQWTVGVLGAEGKGAERDIGSGMPLQMLVRHQNKDFADRYSIGRLMSSRDESIALDEAAWRAALAATQETWVANPTKPPEQRKPDAPSGPAMRRIRGFGAVGVRARPDQGLLLLYLIDPRGGLAASHLGDDYPPMVAFGISFPGSDSGVKVEYKVNNVLWQQEFGSTE